MSELLEEEKTEESTLDVRNETKSSNKSAIKLKPFSGKSDVNEFLQKFEWITRFHHWSDEQAALQLGVAMEGEAFDWFMTQANQESFAVLKHKLKAAFTKFDIIDTEKLDLLESCKSADESPFLSAL